MGHVEKVRQGMRKDLAGKLINEVFFDGSSDPPDTRQINSKISNLKSEDEFISYKSRKYDDTKGESIDSSSSSSRKRVADMAAGKRSKKARTTMFETPQSKACGDEEGGKTQSDLYLEGASDAIIPRRLGPFKALGNYWVADIIRRPIRSLVRIIKLPENETDKRCVILEVTHKPLKLSHLEGLYYLSEDKDKINDEHKRGKMAVRSKEQLREALDRSVADQKAQGDSFKQKYIFYAPNGAIWTKDSISVLCSDGFCGIRWQVRQEFGVDDLLNALVGHV
ncbi:hypothetical protein AAMO2058_000758000 [Amorphochlora amoebiformis]